MAPSSAVEEDFEDGTPEIIMECDLPVFPEHVSNNLPITGMTLPGDKDGILRRIHKALIDNSPGIFRPEWSRGL